MDKTADSYLPPSNGYKEEVTAQFLAKPSLDLLEINNI